MKNQAVDIIIPTWNNAQQLMECVESIMRNYLYFPFHIYIVNNGSPHVTQQPFFDHPYITVLYPDHNLGWEGGINLGLEHAKSDFVMFLNDDIVIPEFSKFWLRDLMQVFHDTSVSSVGPSTNVVMGAQNIFASQGARTMTGIYQVPYLIGFCVLHRRSALEAIKENDMIVDETLPGGDDLDWSIRLQDKGYRLMMHRNVFIWHHGFQTGTRLHGDHTVAGGWNSPQMSETTNMALIKKHGLKKWFETLHTRFELEGVGQEDSEGEIVRSFITGEKVADLGCGGKKTTPEAVGVDEIAKGDVIPMLTEDNISQADVVADVTQTLPFPDDEFDTVIARHILEHVSDPIKVLREWGRIVTPGGRLIVAVPNQDERSAIPLNPEHLHAWNADSFRSLAKLLGFNIIAIKTHYNNVSLVAVLEKV